MAMAAAPRFFEALLGFIVLSPVAQGDLTDYARAHRELDACYADPEAWSRKAIINVGCSGRFSSDRTIREYADQIWNMRTSPVV
jgi:glucan phosphorylase